MFTTQHNSFRHQVCRCLAVALSLWFGGQAGSTVVRAQDSEAVVSPMDVSAGAAYALLKDYMPPGAEPTSGFRTSADQLRIIRHYADMEGIPYPPKMSVDKPETWSQVLAQLRAKKYQIANPGSSPHESFDRIVIDIARANLDDIEQGCRRAEKKGLVAIARTIMEPKNNAVHVELNITGKGMVNLGLNWKKTQVDKEMQGQVLTAMRDRLGEEPNPERRIEYLKAMQKMTDPNDFGAYQSYGEQISKNQGELAALAKNAEKKKALDAISRAEQTGDPEQALQLAQRFADQFPTESPGLVAKLRAKLLLRSAIDQVFDSQWDCVECREAAPKVDEVLQLLKTANVTNTSAQRFQNELTAHLSYCRTKFILTIVLWVLLGAGVITAGYVLLRPRTWVLECLDGPNKGENYDLSALLREKSELVIGAVGGPEGQGSDIVIDDRHHQISRLHCVLYRDGRHFYLRDQSRNGTKIDGQPLEKDSYYKLKKGNEISLADETTLLFRPL